MTLSEGKSPTLSCEDFFPAKVSKLNEAKHQPAAATPVLKNISVTQLKMK